MSCFFSTLKVWGDGVYIIRCDAFDVISGRHDSSCCSDCHERNTLIIVTPYRADVRPDYKPLDFELGIQAIICCGRYDYVRSLSREWWVRAKGAVDGWSEEKVKELLAVGSWHPLNEVRKQAPMQRTAPKKRGCPKCGNDWDLAVCRNCGHSNL